MAKKELIGHTKLKKLARRLNIPNYAAVGLFECLWHLTAREAPRGDIGKLTNEDIAIAIDWDGADTTLMAGLIHCGWVDSDEHHRLIIHDWADHAQDSIHMALARKVLVFADGSLPNFARLSKDERARIEPMYAHTVRTEAHGTHINAHVERTTIPNLTITKPNPTKSNTVACGAEWEEFCRIYPRRNGNLNKSAAKDKFCKLSSSHADILAGVQRYRAWADREGKTGTGFVAMMTTWLNGKQWLEDWAVAAKPNLVEQRDRVLRELGVEPV